MAQRADSATETVVSKRKRLGRRRADRAPSPESRRSRTFEGASIEDALVAAAQEFGPNVEVTDARRARRGGVFGFFARECFEVTALEPGVAMAGSRSDGSPSFEQVLAQAAPDAARPTAPPAPTLDQVLARMADGVVDTIELRDTTESVGEPAPRLPSRRTRIDRPSPTAERRAELADRAVGLIDLRQGRRIPADPLRDGVGVRERPSQLRRRLLPGGDHAEAANRSTGVTGNPLTRELPGPVLDLRDTRPDWSVDRLRELGLGERVLALVTAFSPTSDLEWVQALATAIQVLMPEDVSGRETLLAGEGRASAVGLVQALAAGQLPAVLLIDGQQIPATPEELALSIRECLR